jgi:TfoX/Sxy family transcriptional regulator of competence genes
MAFDAELADRVRAELGPIDGVVELRMFGGWGVTIHGNMAVGVMDRDLIVRVGPQGFDDALGRPGARPFDFTGRPMTGWVFVDHGAIAKSRALASWVAKGVSYAQGLPPKTAKAKPRARAASKRRPSR